MTLPPAAKRILSIAFVAAIVFFGARTCQVESADCELVFRFRDAPKVQLVELEVRLYDEEPTIESESLGQFTKYYEDGRAGAEARWPLVISAGDYWIGGEIRTAGKTVSFTREVTLVDGEALSVYLDRYLRD